MSDKEFCEYINRYFGNSYPDEIDNLNQWTVYNWTGDEMKEFVEHCIKLHDEK